jgi:hypothetical protein
VSETRYKRSFGTQLGHSVRPPLPSVRVSADAVLSFYIVSRRAGRGRVEFGNGEHQQCRFCDYPKASRSVARPSACQSRALQRRVAIDVNDQTHLPICSGMLAGETSVSGQFEYLAPSRSRVDPTVEYLSLGGNVIRLRNAMSTRSYNIASVFFLLSR